MNIISSQYQTKEWRLKQEWYHNGKHNECEKYQINQLEKLFRCKIEKTNDRINFYNNTIENMRCPNKLITGYHYTENFDGLISKFEENKIYFNLKFVSGSGGAQTRTLREVYHFVNFQIRILEQYDNIFFLNILDGDTSFKNMNKFKHLLESYNKEKNNRSTSASVPGTATRSEERRGEVISPDTHADEINPKIFSGKIYVGDLESFINSQYYSNFQEYIV